MKVHKVAPKSPQGDLGTPLEGLGVFTCFENQVRFHHLEHSM